MKKIIAGSYLRLSKESKEKENSIDFQREIINKYAVANNIKIKKEYVDNGYSGMLDSRPGLNKMIIDILRKNINMVIVKDISRLTRNKNKTGWYTEIFFPDNDIRFVSVTELIDSGERYTIDDSIMLRGIANQYYVKDISKKIKANKLAMKQAGKYVESKLPYGYIKNEKNEIIVDTKIENIIKMIFKEYIYGKTSGEIAKFLNKKNINTPSEHMNMKKQTKLWSAETINSILNNPFYTGKFILNKYSSNYITKKCRRETNKDNWQIKENHHPKIIEMHIYNKVQEIKKQKKSPTQEKYKFLLRDCISCGECKRKMQYKKYEKSYFICSMVYKVERKCNNKNKILEKDINQIVKNEIKNRLRKIDFINKLKNNNKIKSEKELENLKRKKYYTYNQKCKGELNEEEFKKIYNEINKKIKEKQNSKIELNNCILDKIIDEKIDNTSLKKFLEKIYCYRDNTILLKLKI